MSALGVLVASVDLAIVCAAAVLSAVARAVPAALATGLVRPSPVVVIAEGREFTSMDPTSVLLRAGCEPAAVLTYDAKATNAELEALCQKAVASARAHRARSVLILANWSDSRRIGRIAEALRLLPVPVLLLPDARTATILRHGFSRVGRLTAAKSSGHRSPLSSGRRNARLT